MNGVSTDRVAVAAPSGGKLDEIQVLRAVAALLVVLYHVTGLFGDKFGYVFAGSMFYFGFAGCDLFFVISGFIILHIHERDLGVPSRLGAFLRKRFFRIFPLYWIVTLAIVPVYFLFSSLGLGYERDPASIVNSLLLIPHQNVPILAVGWTLTFELLCYATFSMGIVVSRNFALAIGLAWQLVAIRVLFGPWIPAVGAVDLSALGPWGAYLISRFNLEFFLGCLIVVLLRRPAIRKWRAPFFIAGCLGMVLAALSGPTLDSWAGENRKFLFFGLPSFLLVLGAGSLGVFSGKRLYRLFVQLGEASYAIYLTHTVFLSFLVKLFQRTRLVELVGGGAAATVSLTLAVAMGYCVYLLLDKPLQRITRAAFVPHPSPGLSAGQS